MKPKITKIKSNRWQVEYLNRRCVLKSWRKALKHALILIQGKTCGHDRGILRHPGASR